MNPPEIFTGLKSGILFIFLSFILIIPSIRSQKEDINETLSSKKTITNYIAVSEHDSKEVFTNYPTVSEKDSINEADSNKEVIVNNPAISDYDDAIEPISSKEEITHPVVRENDDTNEPISSKEEITHPAVSENDGTNEPITNFAAVEDVPYATEIQGNASQINTPNSTALNITENGGAKNNGTFQTKKAVCLELEPREISDVEIVNATLLQKLLTNNPNITSRSVPANCFLVYFFSPYCPFSTQGSAYVNALARSLPNIPIYGFDSIAYHSFNARYGIMGTPSLVLFHNGNVAGRYNSSEFSTFYLETFVHHFTDQKLESINVTSKDFKARLPTQVLVSPPFALYTAWLFLLMCGTAGFLKSEFCAKLTEAFLNNWREAEAQHEHQE